MPRSLRSNYSAPDIFPFVVQQPMADLPLAGPPIVINAPAAIMATEVWTENPLTGDFNPGTTAGQKIFLEKTKGLAADKRLALTNSNSSAIMEFFKVKEQTMGEVITHIPTTWAGGVGGNFMNLIHQSPSISMDCLQRAAFRRFGTPLADNALVPAQPWTAADLDPATVDDDKKKFFSRVHANVVVENIKNCLTPSGWEDLMLEKDKFTFVTSSGGESYDGPVMLKVIFENVDPTSSVNIELHRQAIEGAKLHDFKGNVVEMLKSIEKHHQSIVGNGHSYDSDTYRRHLLSALLSGSNDVFNTKLQSIKSDVDAGNGYNADIVPGALITSAKQQYINIFRRGEWNKVDPRDATILALTTALKDKAPSTHSEKPSSGAATGEVIPGMHTLQKWRTVFKGKSIDKDGVTWTWCHHHKRDGVYDGLYYHNHTPETHDEWRKGKRDWKKKDEKTETPARPEQALKISDALKNALCTNLCISEEDLKRIEDSMDQKN